MNGKKKRPAQRQRKTLKDRKDEALSRGHSKLCGAVAHVLRDQHVDPAGYDQWYLSIVLTTLLAYLYLRRWEAVLFGFVVWYVFENLVWLAICYSSHGMGMHLKSVESRDRELIADPAVFAMALLLALYAFEYSFLANGAGASPPLPLSTADLLRAAVVIVPASWSGFIRLYWLLFGALLAIVWIVFTTDSGSAYQLWLALRATGTVGFVFAWFVRPISRHFLYNALFALLYAATAVALIDVVLTLQTLSFWVAIAAGISLVVLSVIAYHHNEHIKTRIRVRKLASGTGPPPSSEVLASQFFGANSTLSRKRGFRAANFLFYVLPVAKLKYAN